MSGVKALEGAAGWRAGLRQLDEWGRDVDAVDDDPPPRQLVSMAPRAAADVEHPLVRLELQRRDHVVDLLHRPLGERVPQVRRPEVLGDWFKPVVPTSGLNSGLNRFGPRSSSTNSHVAREAQRRVTAESSEFRASEAIRWPIGKVSRSLFRP